MIQLFRSRQLFIFHLERARPRLGAACTAAALTALLGCGSSATTTITSPGSVSKCAVSVTAPGAPLPSGGGGGQVAVTTARECAWSAASENAWLSIKSGASGQGDGAVQFEAVANPDPAVRRGAIVLNSARAEIVQAAGECTITLASEAASFDPSGGAGRIDVRASSGLCGWTAVSDAEWLVIRSGASGTGAGAVAFDVTPTAGPPRTGTITVAGHRFVVTQSQGCAYTLTPTTFQVGSEGGASTVAVATGAGCTWAASSGVDWVRVTSGETPTAGPGTVGLTVAPTSGPTRSAVLTIAGLPFTVTQGQGCSYALSPDSGSVPAAGGNISVAVAAGSGCGWTASSSAPWIVVTSGAQGSGNGTVQLAVSATTGPNRSGSVAIAGRTFTVNQGQGCTFTISPSSAAIDAAGGQGSFTVQTTAGCAWSANKDADWISITAGASGSGGGTVTFSATANPGPARSATITAAGQAFTVTQAGGCSYGLSSTGANLPGGGGNGSVGVTSAAGCGWTAASNADWVTITAGSSGSGNGTVSFSAPSHSGPARSGTLTIAGLTFTVTQGESCAYTVSPAQANVGAGGGGAPFAVDTAGGCKWSAAANASWLSVPAGAGGTGNGTVQVTAAANNSAARSGTATIAGRTVTINQAGGCTYSLSPGSASAPAGGGPGSVGVTSAGGCTWTAASGVPWITISSGASGNGGGTVQYTVDANTGAARSGSLTIAGQTFTVSQPSGCSYSITPTAQTVPGPGSSGSVNVTAPGSCGWTAASNVPWARVTAGASGTGNGTVQYAADPNTGPARSGTFTIAGQTFTLSQDADCSYTVAPDTFARSSAGSAEFVDVTAPSGCAWTAASNVPWLTLTGATSGAGAGRVDFTLAANTGPARSGTLTVATRTVTINQDSGCTYTLGAPSYTSPGTGGPSSVTVSAGAGCTWTAVSQVPWITVTAGAAGTGDGTVQFNVDPNSTGAPRSGTITIAGQTFTVNEQ